VSKHVQWTVEHHASDWTRRQLEKRYGSDGRPSYSPRRKAPQTAVQDLQWVAAFALGLVLGLMINSL
jgi:hypothetical protein